MTKINVKSTLTQGSIKEMDFNEVAKGCVFGAFVGDSCGSYLEFEVNGIAEHRMIKCMEMPGGGPHYVGPG